MSRGPSLAQLVKAFDTTVVCIVHEFCFNMDRHSKDVVIFVAGAAIGAMALYCLGKPDIAGKKAGKSTHRIAAREPTLQKVRIRNSYIPRPLPPRFPHLIE